MSTKRILAAIGLIMLLSTSAVAAPSFSVSKTTTRFTESLTPENIAAAKKQQMEKKAVVSESKFHFDRITNADLVAFVKAFPEATNIEIHSNELTSYAPLAELKNLQKIRARASKVSDMTPLANLTQLNTIDIEYTAAGQDLSWTNKLVNLQNIILLARGLSSVEGLPTLPKLYRISLEGIAAPKLDALVPVLPNLTTAELRYGTFTDISALTKLPKLTNVNFYGASIKDFSPLAAAPALKALNYYATKGTDYSSLGTLKQVQTLSGGLTELDSIAWIQDMPNLKKFDVFSEKVTDYTPLKNAPNINNFSIWKMDVPVGDLAFLKPLKNLAYLKIDSNEGVKGYEALGELTKMQYLFLVDNDAKENPTINFAFIQKMTDLRGIRLSGSTAENLSFQGLKKLGNIRLDRMNLGDATKGVDLSTFKDLPDLTMLDLRECKLTNFQNMDAMPRLRSLDITKSTGVTDLSVLSKFPALKTLTVSKDAFTDAQLAAVPKTIKVNKR